MPDESLNYTEALRRILHRMSISELNEATGVSATTWKRIRRHCNKEGWVDHGQPMANLWPMHGQPMANEAKSEGFTPSTRITPLQGKGEAEPQSDRTKLFDEWSSAIHPKQLNFAKRYEIDIESVVLEYRAYCLGKEAGLKVVSFGESFWQFLQTAKRNGQHQRKKDKDYQDRMKQIDKDRQQRLSQYGSNPDDKEHPSITAERERRRKNEEETRKRYEGL